MTSCDQIRTFVTRIIIFIQVDLGETVRAIDNMRLVVHEGRTHAQNVVSREGEGRSSVSSRGSASAREYQVKLIKEVY